MKALNLPVGLCTTLTKINFTNLKKVLSQVEECAKCRNPLTRCDKWKAEVIDSKLSIKCEPCNKFRQKQKSDLLKSAGIPKIFRDIRAGKDFKVTSGNREAVICAEKAIDNNEGLYLWGRVGTGKTMLSCIIANERAEKKKPSLFLTVPDMLDELRDFDDPKRRAEKLRLLYNVPCLIIDDIGAEYPTEWSAAELFRILDARYKSNLQTIINSNFSLEKLSERIKGYHGERITRRIKALCKVVYMDR